MYCMYVNSLAKTYKGRFLHQLKPKVTTKTHFDFPNTKLYSLIAQLRIRYAKLNDYMQKRGSLTRTCKCEESETIEHYLLHCELYFNERASPASLSCGP